VVVSSTPSTSTTTTSSVSSTSTVHIASSTWIAPAAGAVDVSQTPELQWGPVEGAAGYELVIDDGTPISLTETSYTLPVALDYGSTHTWKVRAVSGASASDWVSGSFTIMDNPASTPATTPSPTPTPSPSPSPTPTPTTTTSGGGGGGGGGGGSSSTKPTVKSVSPANDATGVAVNTHVTATFSKAMDASTISEETFTLKDPNQSEVLASVTYNSSSKTATLEPAALLASNSVYTATITTDVKDTDGKNLASEKAWSFTTTSDTTPPQIESVSPAGGAQDIALNTTVYAVFSEDLDESAINSSSFTLKNGNIQIPGEVTYNDGDKKIDFTPSNDLIANTTYTATVFASVTDSAGNPLTSNHVWSFKTGGSGNLTGVSIITPSSVTPGQEFSVEIQVSNVTDLMSYQFQVNFDNTIIELDSTTYYDGIEDGKVGSVKFSPSWSKPGTVSIRWASVAENDVAVNGDGYLTRLHFKALKAGSTSLVFTDIPRNSPGDAKGFNNKLFDHLGFDISFGRTDGAVSVSAP
jgi:hypothetical protein